MKSEKTSYFYRYTPYKKNKIYKDKIEMEESMEEEYVDSVEYVEDNESNSYISDDNDSGYDSVEVAPNSWLNKLFISMVRLFYVYVYV